jgi:hypothetical protein
MRTLPFFVTFPQTIYDRYFASQAESTSRACGSIAPVDHKTRIAAWRARWPTGNALISRRDTRRVDKRVRCLMVAVLAPALVQHVLFVRLYYWEPLDFPKITAEDLAAAFQPAVPGLPMISTLCRQLTCRPASFETKLSSSKPIVNLISKHYHYFRR